MRGCHEASTLPTKGEYCHELERLPGRSVPIWRCAFLCFLK